TWCGLGLSLWAALRALPFFATELSFLAYFGLLLAAVSLAMVAGFLSLISGGLGVREWVLDELLSPLFGDVVALSATLLLRVVWLVTELAVSGILYVVIRRPVE
ncbi:MAG: hypothetical protein KDA60_23165, partial [Planctomycetales bacterium]|nr:hypothetical protein [Planctomycetales bacterium]